MKRVFLFTVFFLVVALVGCNGGGGGNNKPIVAIVQTSIISGPSSPTNSRDASFVFSCASGTFTFECRLDGGGWISCSSPQNYFGLNDGDHTFEVRVIDAAGHFEANPPIYRWTVDTIPPDTIIDLGPSDPNSSSEASLVFSCTGGPCTFECQFDNGGWSACSSPQSYFDLVDGGHNFEVRATDDANNVDPSPATYTWVVDTTHHDTTPPNTFIINSPLDPSGSEDAHFTFICGEGGCTFQCQLDGGDFSPCTSPMDFMGLTEGLHIFIVQATDAAGNIDPSPANWSWVINTIQPDKVSIKIDALSDVTIEYPSSSDPLVLYPGITAERVCDLVGLNVSFNADFSELTMEVVNNGTADLNRLWMIDTGARNFGLLNPDAFNKSNQEVTVYGPISPGAGMSRKFQVQIGTLPAYISFDCLEVKDRIVYSSNYGQALRRRNWTMAMDKTDFFQVTNPDNEYLQQTTPSWSPVMEWIAYAQTDYSDPAYQSVIYVVHPDGAAPIQVTDSGKYSEQPYFSPTGKEVIYVCQLRTPESSFDICTHGIYGGPETDLIRGDGYYWDGSAYLQYAPAHWLLDKVFQPRYTPDGQYITFLAQEPNSAPSPVAKANRMVLLGMPFDPLTGLAKSAPARVGKVINGDTITSSTKFLGLGECVPSFSADGQYMFCFLREYVKTTSWSLNFYGLARISIQDLLASPNSYIGSHVLRIYDIRTFQSQTKALYINFPEYVPELGGVLFSLKWHDYKVDMEMLQLNSSMQPVGAPTVFFSDEKINWTPRIPYRLFPGLYQ